MRSFKVLGAAAAVLGLLATASASAGVPAHVAGGDAGPPMYPSIVNVRLVRTQAALERAVEYVDTAQADKAVAQLLIARTQLRKAWTGAKYVIDTAPPPVAGDGAVGRSSGAPVGGSPYADQYATAFAVVSLQHDVAATAIGLADGAKTALLSSLSTTIFTALNARDAAIAYVHSKDTPPAPARNARASGAPIAAGWGSVMPGATFQLDDEMQQIDGLLKGTVSTGAGKVYKAAELQDTKTERTINQYWPPAPAG
jgi:hypothetical protein